MNMLVIIIVGIISVIILLGILFYLYNNYLETKYWIGVKKSFWKWLLS